MSKRNSQEAKRDARERLRAEREKQAKRDRMRRQLIVAGAAVGVLGVGALVAVAISNAGGGGSETDWEAVNTQVEEAAEGAEDGAENAAPDYEIPANASGEDGLTILIGDEDAANEILLFEETRCGGCAGFDRAMGETIKNGIADGDFSVEYSFGTFFDEQQPGGGTGSRNSVQALGAALDVSEDAFLEYLGALYSEEFHTSDNGQNDFEDDERLIEIAESVDALSDDMDSFTSAIEEGRFATWAVMLGNTWGERAGEYGVTGTPSVVVNGEMQETPYTPEDLYGLLS